MEIPFTYSIKFIKNNEIRWANRWNYILKSVPQVGIQWFSILNSSILAVFLSSLTTRKLFRALDKNVCANWKTMNHY